MRMRRQMAGVVVVGLVAVGCGNIAERAAEEVVERAAENAGGGDVDIDFDDGGVDIEGEDYSLDTEVGGLPADFPSEVVLPPQFEVEGGFKTEESGRTTWSASGVFNGDCDNDFLGFVAGLPSAWTPQEGVPDPDCSGTLNMVVRITADHRIQYTLLGEPGDWQFQVAVQTLEQSG